MKSIIKGCVVGLLLVTGGVQAGNSSQEVQNKNNVLEFYQQGLNNKDFVGPRALTWVTNINSIIPTRRMVWRAFVSLSSC